MVDSATAEELVNLILGILILYIAIRAQRKFNFSILKRGFDIIAVSGGLMALSSSFGAYYTYMGSYELIPLGRAFLVVALIMLIGGLYTVGSAALKICGEEESEGNRT
jgi:hypothetical protein